MNFTIPVETYLRLAGVPKIFSQSVSEEEREILRCVRLEHRNGSMFAIGTNRRVAAIYYLGKASEPMANGSVHVTLDPALIAQCEVEKPFNSKMHVVTIPEMQMVSLKTDMGYNYPGMAGKFPPKTALDDWNKWVVEPASKSSGAMSWSVEDMTALNSASPSGHIVFPTHIDANKPIVVRDIKNDNWVGLFMGNRRDDDGNAYTAAPATIPEWLK